MTNDADKLAETETAAADGASGETPRVRAPAPVALGRFRLERQLGEGGMGVVHAAYDPELERRVALKVLRGHTSPDARARLLREAKAMARLAHPNVVTVHDVGTADGRDYVAMELVDGDNLATWLRDARRSAAEIVEVFVAAGRGLAAAHAAGLVHRDFKPHNVLRSRAGRVQVTDFGLARASGRDAATAVRADAPIQVTLTATGSVLGTPAYMAPEQWRGETVGPAADQFAFCVALWEALAGERPYRAESTDELRAQVERGPATLDASKIPRRYRALLRRGLDPDPAKRWPGMDTVIASLEPRRRGPWIAIAAAIIATVATFQVIEHFRSSPAAPPKARLDDAVLSVQRFSGGVVRASPRAVTMLLDEIRTQTGARFVPTIEDEDEGPIGFKLFAIKRGSMLDSIGLANGDILTQLAEQPVTSETDLERVATQLSGTTTFRLEVRRGDDETSIVISPKF